MAPTNGSDSERLMAQIEAFLRTGEAPPAAPEPEPRRRSPLPPTRPYEPGGPDPLDSSSVWARPPRFGGRLARRWARLRGRPAGLRSESTPRAGASTAGAGASTGPQWTPLRAVLVVGGLAALLVLPVIWTGQTAHESADATDKASTAPAGPGYSFLEVNTTGAPVRWDPCEPVHYQLDLASAPTWAVNDVGRALAVVSSATGIDFAYDGQTSQFPSGEAARGSGSVESPVEIAWATKAQSQALGLPVDLPSAAGSFPGTADTLARTVPYIADDQSTGHMIYVTGTVVLSAAASSLPAGFVAGGEGVLLLHQLGRLLGLGDVSDTNEIMNPGVVNTGVTALGSGDRAGLDRLGQRSGCQTVPANASIQPAF